MWISGQRTGSNICCFYVGGPSLVGDSDAGHLPALLFFLGVSPPLSSISIPTSSEAAAGSAASMGCISKCTQMNHALTGGHNTHVNHGKAPEEVRILAFQPGCQVRHPKLCTPLGVLSGQLIAHVSHLGETESIQVRSAALFHCQIPLRCNMGDHRMYLWASVLVKVRLVDLVHLSLKGSG